jgi:pimeloyl-ACP methyl ester carboxylesterase
MTEREEVWFDHTHGYYYAATGEAAYALMIVHGIGGNGSTYDVFCHPLAARGVSIYSMDLAGHGKTRNEKGNFRQSEWLADMDIAAKAIRARHPGKRLFVLGSSMGSSPAFHSLAVSDAIDGAISMGVPNIPDVVPRANGGKLSDELLSEEGARKEAEVGDTERFDLTKVLDWNKNYAKDDPDILAKKMKDPLRAWSYGYASMRSLYTYQPPIPASQNRKPYLMAVGGNDPLVPTDYAEEVAGIIGNADIAVVKDGTHQLMLYHTDVFVPLVDNWVRDQFDKLS